MSATVLEFAFDVSRLLLGLAMVASAFRLFIGPRAQDRVLGLDTLYISGMLLLVVTGIRAGTAIFFDIALIVVLIGFTGTVAAARFLLRGEVIE